MNPPLFASEPCEEQAAIMGTQKMAGSAKVVFSLNHVEFADGGHLTTSCLRRRAFGVDSRTRDSEPGYEASMHDAGFPDFTTGMRHFRQLSVLSEFPCKGFVSGVGRPGFSTMESEASHEECPCC